MANVCVTTGLAPSEYKAMTLLERQAYVTEHNRQAEKANRGR